MDISISSLKNFKLREDSLFIGWGGGTFADYGLMALEIAFEASLVYP